MRLLRLKADGFGALRGEIHFDPDRMTVILDDNERGKSTLVAAITAALYGLDGDRRSHRPLTPLERWKPWDGGTYRVEVELECEGERYTVSRDFEAGTVSVWSARGQDVSADFRDGNDYPVGKRLLELDASEFERCALVRQGELWQVVPEDDRERRSPTLRARLEAVADSRVGDTRASEAIRMLETSLKRYDCPELEFTGTIDNALARLEAKSRLLETELQELTHDLEQNAGPLGELADLAEIERETREALAGLDAEWRGVLATDALRQLEEDQKRQEEIETLRGEADGLAAVREMPPDAESQFRDTVARLEEAQRNVSTLEGRRQEEASRQRAELESERQSLATFEGGGAVEADRCVSLGAEIRRIGDEESRLRDEMFQVRESLAGEGHDPERLQWLTHRLGRLSESDHALLRRQSELTIAHHTETATLESQRTTSSEDLRAIDARRSGRTLPGWFLLALGIATLVAGTVVASLRGLPWLSTTFFVAGTVLLGIGIALVMGGRNLRADEREEALRLLADAQRSLNLLKQHRAETETALESLSRQHGYRDHIELLREWNELSRLRQESAPAVHAQSRLAALDARRRQVTEEARELLARFGVSTPDPESLDKVAGLLRQLEAVRQKLAALDRNWGWIDQQKQVDEAAASGLRERALRILQSAGLTYDPSRPWSEHLRELADKEQLRQRLALLTRELIPSAERRRLSEARRAELESQVALAEGGTSAARSPRNQRAIDEERRRLLERQEEAQRKRADLRVRVEEVSRRVHAERPERRAQLERIQRAQIRARRFKESVELAITTIREVAAETHQRWADFLNRRVGELLQMVGATIDQIRFGDDLDFSVRLLGGQMLARGKADQQLSAGARDQLYLAVRLAVSEFLSRGQTPLPFLLDDVFVTSDDERARSGMRLLIELATTHQIVLLTCHRRRYDAMAEVDRELYQGRVQWLDARSVGAERNAGELTG